MYVCVGETMMLKEGEMKKRENVVWGWSKGDKGIMEEGMRKRVKVSKRGRKG